MQKRSRQAQQRYSPYSHPSGIMRSSDRPGLLDYQSVRTTPYPHTPQTSGSRGRGSSGGNNNYGGSGSGGNAAGLSQLALAQAAQFAAFLTAAGYDPSYVATANAAVQAALAVTEQPNPFLAFAGGAQQHLQSYPSSSKLSHELEPGQYKVSKHSICKSVAGKIATDFRVGVLPSLLAKGEAVSVAIKAIALACTYLSGNEVMVACYPHHKLLLEGDESEKRTCVLVLKKVPLAPLEIGSQIVKVAATSEFTRVAGSIARNIRKGASVTVQAFGPNCIAIAVDAVVLARRMLKTEPDGTPMAEPLDVFLVPKFMATDGEKEIGDKKSSGIQFHLFVKK